MLALLEDQAMPTVMAPAFDLQGSYPFGVRQGRAGQPGFDGIPVVLALRGLSEAASGRGHRA
jgi:hypothetical protein